MVAIGFTGIPATLVLSDPIGEHQLKYRMKQQNRLLDKQIQTRLLGYHWPGTSEFSFVKASVW